MSGNPLISTTATRSEGELVFDDAVKLKAQLNFLPDVKLKVDISVYDEKKEKEYLRSIKQNNYYHKILDILTDYTGDEHMDLHDQLKIRFLSRPYIMGDKEYTIVKSTTRLTPKNFADYLEKIFHWAAEELNVTLPSPSDYY